MGCALSNRHSLDSPPHRLEKMKQENGYLKAGHVRPRRSTGTRHNGPGPVRATKPEPRNGNVEERNVVKNSVGNINGNIVDERFELRDVDEENELVDGWPKWLVDNIPREVLRNIVPKSADSYIKIDKVGQGTYSNVYKARDKDTGKIVALKKVLFDTSEPESVKFMAREITILLKLDHPNIIKLEGLVTSRMQYSLYLVFEYMHSDLSKMLSPPDESLTEPQIKCYMQQLLLGLEHCHERGILHRDIKGSNLLIDRHGMLKIADFGLANFYDAEKRSPLTSRVVTLWYRAPELLLGCTDYGIGIDLWSAGCLMAEMFAGRPILPGRTEVEQVHRIFKLCGTPSDDFYKRLKLSTSLKPPQTYKSSLRETFNDFPSSSLGLLNKLLALDPIHRGSASSALRNEFFHTSPLACDLSGLPIIHVEDDDEALFNEKRKHRTNRVRRRSNKEKRKKNLAMEKSKGDALGSKEDLTKNAEIEKEENQRRLFTTPTDRIHEMSTRTEAHPNATKNIKNPPLLPTAYKKHTTNYHMNLDGANRLDLVQKSASTREFRSLENKEFLDD